MSTETTATDTKGTRNFKQSQEIENFYRFVHENGLRKEASLILKLMHGRIKKSTKKKGRSKAKKLQ